ncbi:CxxH/CxxC protein [Mesobacillus harenae]|uniref:CxxH/CxxC protein n=1 Tax=Mesobacillus harenae TaxID=2213203 RepID=UPI0015803FC4
MIYSCDEHIDLALDIAVDEFEIAPKLTKIPDGETPEHTCGYCENPAIYIVANE